MSTDSYNLEEIIYLIIDSEVIQIEIDSYEVENVSQISEETGSILASDSTQVSPVTGYTQNSSKNIKISYLVSQQHIYKIKNSQEVNFRCYA